MILVVGLATSAGPVALAQGPVERSFEVEVSSRTRRLLVAALESAEPTVRVHAVTALGSVGSAEVASSIEPLLRDEAPAVRAEAVTTLAHLLPPSEVAPILTRACGDTSAVVVRRALGVLVRMPGPAGMQALLDARSRVPRFLRADWLNALAQRDEPPPASPIKELLTSPNPQVRAAAARVVSRHPGLLPVAARLELLPDDDPLVRARALLSLHDDVEATEVRDAVVKALADPAPWVRRAALHVLEKAPPALSLLAKSLEDPDPTVRLAAVSVISRVGGRDAAVALCDRFGDPEVLVAEAAADQVGRFSDVKLEGTLIALLDASDEQVVAMAARALGRTGRPRLAEPLRPLVEHPSLAVRKSVYEAFGHLGEESVVPLLIDRAENEPPGSRAALNIALGQLGDRRAIPHLLADINYPDERSKGAVSRFTTRARIPPPYPPAQSAVASAAIRALGQIGDRIAVEPLLEVSYDFARDAGYFQSLAWSLGALGDARASGVLETLGIEGVLVHERFMLQMSDATRIEALRAIARLDLKPLASKIADMDPLRCSLAVRDAAAEVLGQLTGKRYRARPPVRIGKFVLEALDDPPDIRKRWRSIVVPVDENRPSD